MKTLPKYPWLVAVDGRDEVAGYVYAGAHRDPPSYQWSVNTSVFVRADCQGMGVGKSLYEELHRQLADLGYHRAFAGVALPNDASVALHQAVGYRRLGVYEGVGFKFGAWRDVAWFSKVLKAPEVDPEPPRRP